MPKGAKANGTAAGLIPARPTLAKLKRAAAGCQACPLYETGTQTVFGQGVVGANLMLVGEQPGDREDKAGLPFVGPAGRLLDKALNDAEIDRTKAYVTNVVKHFKWTPRGKRRLHSKPNQMEIESCRPWFEAEVEVVRPRVILCLGATAAKALLGASVRVTRDRGKLMPSPWAPCVMATVHPSSLLRAPDDETRRRAYAGFVDDLRGARSHLTRSSKT